MQSRSRNLLFTGALLASVVLLHTVRTSREPARSPAPLAAPAAIDVLLPTTAPARSFERTRQFGLPSASDMLLYFPIAPTRLPAPAIKKL